MLLCRAWQDILLVFIHMLCRQVNVSSLEEVVKYFMKTATARAEDAQSKADADTVRCSISQPSVYYVSCWCCMVAQRLPCLMQLLCCS